MNRREVLATCAGVMAAGAVPAVASPVVSAVPPREPAKPGRVYAVYPKAGERDGSDHEVYIAGKKVHGVYRVELDDDADTGFATVHAYFNAGGDKFVPIPANDNTEAVKVSFRHNVYVAHKDAVNPERVEMTTFQRKYVKG